MDQILPSIHAMVPYCEYCGTTFQTSEGLLQHYSACNGNHVPTMFERPAMQPMQDVFLTDTPSELATSRSSSPGPLTPGSLSEGTCCAIKSGSVTQRATGIKKSEKERYQRGGHAKHLQIYEDILELICGIRNSGTQDRKDKRMQSNGNGDSSGLTVVKSYIFQDIEVILLHMISERFAEAVRNGTKVEFQNSMRELVARARAPGGYPSQGTLFDDGNATPCERTQDKKKLGDPASKRECEIHGHSDYIACRKQRRRKTLAHHVRELRDGEE